MALESVLWTEYNLVSLMAQMKVETRDFWTAMGALGGKYVSMLIKARLADT
jgi:hypothetical protein